MMRRLLGAPFEILNVLGTAVFFTIALALTLFSAPTWLAKVNAMSPETAASHFRTFSSLVGRHGWWIAAAALVGAVIAPYARGDGKKVVAWLRIVCAVTALVLVIAAWGAEGSGHLLEGDVENGRHAADTMRWRSDKKLTPWNGLLAATGMNLVLGAFLVTAGAAKKAKADGGKEK